METHMVRRKFDKESIKKDKLRCRVEKSEAMEASVQVSLD